MADYSKKMKGNYRIGLTAEAVALIRAESGKDLFSKYFVTQRIRRVYGFANALFSKKLLEHIFAKRMELSRDLQSAIEKFKPEQVIDLGAGCSTDGMNYVLAHPNVRWVDTDFPEVISFKERVLKKIEEEKSLDLDNLHLVPIDLVAGDLFKAVSRVIKPGKRTLLVSQGLNTYLNQTRYSAVVDNTRRLLENIGGGSYLSHEPTREQKRKMTPGIGGRILRGAISFLTRSKQQTHFDSDTEMGDYYLAHGFKSFKIVKRRSDNLIYMASV